MKRALITAALAATLTLHGITAAYAADGFDVSHALAATGVGTPLLVWAAVGLSSLGVGTLAVATAGRRAQDSEVQ